MTATVLLCVGCFVAGVGFGGLLGMLVTRADARIGRPDVTAWGESTAQWSETDWDWFEHIGRHSDSAWARRSRDVERIARMAGTDPEGSILPPPADYCIDRSPKTWWTC